MNPQVIVTPQTVTVSTTSQGPTQLTVQQGGVNVVSVGIQGPPGTPGVNGDSRYEQAFSNLSSIVVTHNLGKHPAVSVVDSAGDECVGDVIHTSVNSCTVNFSAPFSGTIFCN
jgi:hypothetical protein